MIKVQLPISKEDKNRLRAYDYIYLSGKVYTMRDAAHRRLINMLKEGKEAPINLEDACIYYTGPSPIKNGRAGSIGPTSSYRMDVFMKDLKMINSTIGKGPRSDEVRLLAKDEGILYLNAIGGLGAKLSLQVKSIKAVAFEDLGAEAIYELEVEDFPVIVAYDILGNSIFKGN